MSADLSLKNVRIFLLTAGFILCLGILPVWPYGYYVFLRLSVCFAAGFAAWALRNREGEERRFAVLVMIALLFNPVFPAALPRPLWMIIDLGTAIYFLSVSKKLR